MRTLETKRIIDTQEILPANPLFRRVSLTTNNIFTLEHTPPAPLPGGIRLAITAPWEDEEVVVDDDIGSRLGAPWKVVLYNDDIHTFDEVIVQLQKALRCSQDKAQNIAYEAHTRGKAIAYAGEFEDCFKVTAVLREIQLIVEIEG
ncbi:ATP-dependent Clp protease adaptor ClpS [candidate division KSB1 bacterium]|nr:ATP-dependent Clp protease adaptor ClpS [candidate division KSB1 bacterium]